MKAITNLDANHHIVSVNKCGLFLCRQGSAQILLGSHIYNIGKNHLCIYTPNTLFQIIEHSTDLDGLLLEENTDMLFPALNKIDIRLRLHIRNNPCIVVTDSQILRLNRLIGLIPTTNSSHPHINDLDSEQRQYLSHALLVEIFKIHATISYTQPTAKRESIILNNFIMHVLNECIAQRTVQYYANKQNLSPYYFSSIIKKLTGKSALQWIGIITIIQAKQHLLNNNLSIKEIAHKFNFPDQSTFGRYFKHLEGISPLKYKSRNQQTPI